jgi:hypothetical protein
MLTLCDSANSMDNARWEPISLVGLCILAYLDEAWRGCDEIG